CTCDNGAARIRHPSENATAGALRAEECGTDQTKEGKQNLRRFQRTHETSNPRQRIFQTIFANRAACTEHKPCYNRARLENLPARCQAKNTDPAKQQNAEKQSVKR